MDKQLLAAAAFRFRTRDSELFRIATATGGHYTAGCLERWDWRALPANALVFVRFGSVEGPLVAGHVHANTLASHTADADERAGLSLRLFGAASGAAPYFIEQRSLVTVFLALERLRPAL